MVEDDFDDDEDLVDEEVDLEVEEQGTNCIIFYIFFSIVWVHSCCDCYEIH